MNTLVFDSPVADASEVIPNLWIGSAPPIGMHVRNNGFTHLILTAQEYQPWQQCYYRVSVIHAPFDDDGDFMTTDEKRIALSAGLTVARLLKERDNKILSTCHQGRNRSSLVAGIAMVCGMGIPVIKTISLIRAARGFSAFRNPHFVTYLKSIEGSLKSKKAPVKVR